MSAAGSDGHIWEPEPAPHIDHKFHESQGGYSTLSPRTVAPRRPKRTFPYVKEDLVTALKGSRDDNQRDRERWVMANVLLEFVKAHEITNFQISKIYRAIDLNFDKYIQDHFYTIHTIAGKASFLREMGLEKTRPAQMKGRSGTRFHTRFRVAAAPTSPPQPPAGAGPRRKMARGPRSGVKHEAAPVRNVRHKKSRPAAQKSASVDPARPAQVPRSKSRLFTTGGRARGPRAAGLRR